MHLKYCSKIICIFRIIDHSKLVTNLLRKIFHFIFQNCLLYLYIKTKLEKINNRFQLILQLVLKLTFIYKILKSLKKHSILARFIKNQGGFVKLFQIQIKFNTPSNFSSKIASKLLDKNILSTFKRQMEIQINNKDIVPLFLGPLNLNFYILWKLFYSF